MKVFTIVMSSISVLMMLSTLLCGFWLRSKGADPEGVTFHINIAVATVIITLVTLGLLIFRVMKS